MRYLYPRRWRTCSHMLLIMTLFLIGIFLLFFPMNTDDQFDYSTVIYPSPFDVNHTNFFIYLDKKSRLALEEDRISLSKQHKIIDDGIREIDTNFLVIEYTRFFGSKKFCSKNSSEIFGDQCPYKNCFYSCNQSLASQAQLLLFHKYDVNLDTVPPKDFIRKSSQIWLLWHDEPNFYHGIDLNIYRFNWTTSYVFDAEASIGAYGMTNIQEKPWTPQALDEYVSREYSSRIHQALWLVTNCGAKRRLKYFRELKEYFPIQVFGSCVLSNESSPSRNALGIARASIVMERSKNQTDLPKDCPRWSSCEEDQVKLNMFYLSFESQSCKDYISEKFWRALKFGLIPIALGPLSREHYRRIAPPNSFIYTNDFPDAQALAQHLYDIINNPTLFRFYHQWRRFYSTGYSASELEKYRLCEICHRLNTMTRRQHYPDVRGFFTQQC